MAHIDAPTFRKALLAWYTQHARPFPWRQTQDAYPIWLSEIMLQQTTTTAVLPYYEKFLTAFPTLIDLAQADEQTVLHHWQGLGYYSRARNLHQCAQVLVRDYNGHVPQTPAELIKLPGIGPYTAHAIAAFAFNHPGAAVLDGNVERVLSRLTQEETPLPQAKPKLKALAEKLADPKQSRAYNNAIMELGATLCTPKSPKCLLCPVSQFCQAKTQNPETYPKKAPKKALPHKTGNAYLFTTDNGEIYLRQRPNKGLLANLWEAPHLNWEPQTPFPPTLLSQTKVAKKIGVVTHTFTHFKLTLTVHHAELQKTKKPEKLFYLNNLPPISHLMKKVIHTHPNLHS